MKIIDNSGNYVNIEDWRKSYNVKAPNVVKYFAIGEPHINEDTIVAGKLMVLLDRFRQLKGEPVLLNSLYRTQEKQTQLIKDGFRAAKTSPHVRGMAADIHVKNKEDAINSINLLNRAAADLRFVIRLGYDTYNYAFIHVDVCPEFYGKDKCWHNKSHPPVWEGYTTW